MVWYDDVGVGVVISVERSYHGMMMSVSVS